ncbi:hypothetical protein I4U23_016111 [Adineta vaga]|nr:hypothetical protein I4U23_016111 [Adineta vaga]
MAFNLSAYNLVPVGYTPGSIIHGSFTRPERFYFPETSSWSTRTSKFRESIQDGRIIAVTVELNEGGRTVHSRTITEHEYQGKRVHSSAPKLAWLDFVQVLKAFMMGNHQERSSDIDHAFSILDQQARGLYGRSINISDGRISPEELQAFLSILTDQYRIDLCILLADTNGSGQIERNEFDRLIKSGLARDIVCGRI